MEITQKLVEYKTEHYRIQVEKYHDKCDVYVFDKNNNLIVLFETLAEAENVSREVLQVLDKVKI